ncbi:MAG: AAA family ATPase [Pseudomonadota bacterium]
MTTEPERLTITPEFERALDAIKRERTHLFVTGKAGTGKSTLLKILRDTVSSRMAVVAPTGLAAVNVGGQTIHSLFTLPPKLITPDLIRSSRNARLIRKLELLVIDEISMVRADLMDAIDKSLRKTRNAPEIPFGGVQLIMFGDLHQLPPVVQRGEIQHYFEETYGGPYFFNAPVFSEIEVPRIELSEVFRQSDERFVDVLNAVRDGAPDEYAVDELNGRVCDFQQLSQPSKTVVLTTTNQAAMQINQSFLSRLPGETVQVEAIVSGEFSQGAFPTEQALHLKEGARVIMLRNDSKGRWVNGTLGTVSQIDEDTVYVEINGEEYEIEAETWENVNYAWDQKAEKIVESVAGKFVQLPLRLAWALTIHKAQGMTLDRVHIDFGRGTFSHGQAYVALSRCRSLSGLTLARPLRRSDVIFDPAITEYRRTFEELANAA